MTVVPDWLSRRALTHGADTALAFEGDALTFAELDRRAAAYDRTLRERGVGAGEVVATLLFNRPELVALAHGIPRRGRIFAPLGVRLTASEIAEMLGRCAPRILFYEQATEPVVAALPSDQGIERIRIDTLSPPTVAPHAEAVHSDLDATHTIVFTSGTGGPPKAVRLTWGNHLWSATASALNLGLLPDDRWLCCMPLHHVGGLAILMRSALYGNAVELQRRFDPEDVNEAIRERGVTIVSVVANMLQRMLDADGDRPYPPSLRAVLVGGGPVPRALLERCRRNRIPVLHTYGLTETASQVVTARPGRDDAGVGTPLVFTEIRITDELGEPVANGIAGDIEVRGPMVSPGYLGEPKSSPRHWLHTRDRGWIDDRGCLHVLGRGDDTIVCGGENVHPGEIEQTLESHPSVAEAFAAGVDDPRWGAVMHAAVRLVAATTEAELLSYCRLRLAGFKLPRRLIKVEDFPRTAAGKIARREARRLFTARGPGPDES